MNGNIVKNKLVSALITNTIPIIGVLFWEWSALMVLLLYWLETAVIGLFNVFKMWRATGNYSTDKNNKLIPGLIRPITKPEHLILPAFFVVHYSMFLFGHLAFLNFLGIFIGQPIYFGYGILLTLIPFLYTQTLEYRNGYLANKTYGKVPIAKLMFLPYRRIFVMHATIIVGAAPIMFAANFFPPITVLLVLLKIFIDFKSQAGEDKLLADLENQAIAK